MVEEYNGRYEHYSGQLYEVKGVAKHTETDEKLVLYVPLYDCPDLEQDYGMRPYFVRPFEMFFEDVELNGSAVPRFKRVD